MLEPACRITVYDDFALIRHGLRALLRNEPGYTVRTLPSLKILSTEELDKTSDLVILGPNLGQTK